MFVDPQMLHTGAGDSSCAGEHARWGVDALSLGRLPLGMFGEFAAAEAYHRAASAAHAQHVANLQAYQRALTDIGSKAHCAAARFSDMDARSAAEMNSVPCVRPDSAEFTHP